MGRLSEERMMGLCRRLSSAEKLVLPASLTRDREDPLTKVLPIFPLRLGDRTVVQEEVEGYLSGLVLRDPSVFLERYGSHLVPEELLLFEHLSDDYEVSFYLKQFQRTDPLSTRDTSVKNRRLAYMMKLMDEGEYFGDERMRERDPLLFQQYVGKHCPPPSVRPKTLSESILLNADEEEVQIRLADAERCEQEATEEVESDEDAPPEQQPDVEDPVKEERFMRSEFESIMQERFLMGKDADYIDYSAIDNDIRLDDDLLEIEDRDEEDRYFDTD